MPNGSQPDAPEPVSTQQWAAIVLVAAFAFTAKLLLALKTYGTNDVYTYQRFAVWSGYFGADLYKIAPDLNHPPSMLHILRFLLWLSEHTLLPFHFWIRFPGILADIGTLWLICRILGARLSERPVFTAVLLIALAPIHILISGFHGNTDPVMIFFVMAAVWLAGYRGNVAAGGVAFGLAICIKIAPVILVPVLFLSLPTLRKRVMFFAAAAAVILIAWSPYVFEQPTTVIHQVFGYKSSYGLWGFSWLFRQLANAWPAAGWLNIAFSRAGTPLVVVAILALSAAMHRMNPKPSLYTRIGMVFLLFFTATSGFAVQYLAWLTPWVAELGVFPVAWFVMTGSVFLLVVYNYWTLGAPWYLAIAYPWGSHQYFQLLCWMSVVFLTIAAWHRIRHNRDLILMPARRLPPILRYSVAALAAGSLLIYPAILHMKRDRLGASPTYAEDTVAFTQADEYHNLASELSRRGRTSEAGLAQHQADILNSRGQTLYDALVRAEPVRLNLRTPEDYVESSLYDYNSGQFSQCVFDATESLKLRPDTPAAWNNIALCNAQLGDWDAAVAAATQALRVEPESEVVRQNLDWTLAEKRRAAAYAGR